MGKCSSVIWNYFSSRMGSLSGSYFFLTFFSLNNVCMFVTLIILILFIPNIETAIQFLTTK